MEKKNLIITVVAFLVVIGGAVLVLVSGKPAMAPQAPTGGASPTPSAPSGGGRAGQYSKTWSAVPAGETAVPGAMSTGTPSGVAVPKVVVQAAPSSAASFRSFDITAKNNAFTPDTIVVHLNDIVHIKMTAVGKDYDFTQPDFGYKLSIPAGTTKPIEFGAMAAGKFTFYCTSCGGPAKGPVGYIVVVPNTP